MRKILMIICFIMLSLQFLATAETGEILKNNCSRELIEFKNLKMDSLGGVRWEAEEYRKENDVIIIGPIESRDFSYLFVKGKYYGIAIDIVSKDELNEAVRYFGNNYGPVYNNNKTKQSVYFYEDEVIVVTRFTTHLAQIQILCRDMFVVQHGIEVPSELKK